MYQNVILDYQIAEEFVAHSSNVNCLKIGKKSSRVLVTGGEDHKVNMWAIGKPNAILVRCCNLNSAPGGGSHLGTCFLVRDLYPWSHVLCRCIYMHLKWNPQISH